MIRVAPFIAADMLEIDVQPAQQSENYRLSLYEMGRMQSESGVALTARCALTGRILIVGGYAESHRDYATLWAVLAIGKGAAMQTITRRVRALIAGMPHRRIDAMIHGGLEPAQRWARMIGLRHEATLAEAMPDGGNAMIFRRF